MSLPNAISTATIAIMGTTLRVHVLEDGQRVIDAEDVEKFFARLDTRPAPTDAEVLALVQAIQGVR